MSIQSEDDASAEDSAVQSSPNPTAEPGAITQTVGGKSYTLNPSKIKPTPTTILAKAKSYSMTILAAPFMASFFSVFSTIMLLGTQNLRSFLISKFIPFTMSRMAKLLKSERDILLQDVSGTVMDVGSGGGAYFRHFTRATRVVSIEPVEQMHPKLKLHAKEVGLDLAKVTFTTELVEEYLKNHPEERGTFDWIILGNVMCEVHSLTSTAGAINELLKPGGHVYFCEHIAKPKGTILRRVQDLMNPWWIRVSMGCNCNRDTMDAIRSVPDWQVIVWDLPITGGMPWIGPFVMGLIRKKDAA